MLDSIERQRSEHLLELEKSLVERYRSNRRSTCQKQKSRK